MASLILRHATPRKNLRSILRSGLLTARSKGRLPAVWLHSPAATGWAVLHTVARHGGRAQDVVILEVRVPRRWLRRKARSLWFTRRDVPPARIARVVGFAELAGSQTA